MEHTPLQSTIALRNLYFTRTVVQLAWAAAVFATITHPVVGAALLVVYPLWDVACTFYDRHTQGANATQIFNIAAGLLTAAAMAATATTHPAYSIAAFGIWALAAGVLQLSAGLIRRKQLGGQWAMILSGAQSSIAGISFLLGGLSGKLHASNLAGYAIFGGVYFAVAGVLLARKLSANQPA